MVYGEYIVIDGRFPQLNSCGLIEASRRLLVSQHCVRFPQLNSCGLIEAAPKTTLLAAGTRGFRS